MSSVILKLGLVCTAKVVRDVNGFLSIYAKLQIVNKDFQGRI